jgi:hypothetical protein
MNIPNASDFVTTTSAITSFRLDVSAGTATSIGYYVSDDVETNNETLIMFPDYIKPTNVYRKVRPKFSKKKRGDVSNANHPDNRLKVLEPIVIFKFIKNRFNLLQQKKLSTRLEKVCELLQVAESCQQIALRDKIKEKFGKFLREQEIISCGFTHYIDKVTLQRFIDRSSKKIIKLTKLKNYIRVIPKNVRVKLERAQKAKLFDEYVVLHTDPDNKAIEKTKEEKKDPILFGIVNESLLYYVVGDWVDKYCDITMDKIFAELSEDKDNFEIEPDVKVALDNVMSEEHE